MSKISIDEQIEWEESCVECTKKYGCSSEIQEAILSTLQEVKKRNSHRLGIDVFEDAIRDFGVKQALEYFATPEELHHLFEDLKI